MKSSLKSGLKLFLLCYVHLCMIYGVKSFRSDYKYYDKAGGWLKVHRISANWEEAKLRCYFEGATLASPLENLKDALLESTSGLGLPKSIFTGINALYSRGDYHTIEGLHISQIPIVWAKGEPDNRDDRELCLVMRPDGTIADTSCSETHPYVCYKKYQDFVLNECGTIDPEYKLDTRTGSCYKMHRNIQTWTRAFLTCTAEGGHLAIINSPTESQVLKELCDRYPENTIKGKFFRGVVFIGFQYWNDTADFYTIDGKTLEEAGFSTFSSGQPDNAPPGEYCGGMWRSGLLDDVWCTNTQPYICEKKPGSLVS